MKTNQVESRPRWQNCWIVLLLLVAALGVAPEVASATTFDWNQSYGTWTAGAPADGQTKTQIYNSDPTHQVNAVQVSIKNTNTGGFTWNTGYPQVSDTPITGGFGATNKSLQLYALTNNATGIVVTTQFNYAYGVNDVSIILMDVDKSAGQFIDVINDIKAVTLSGATVAATSITTSADNTLTGSGLTSTVTGTGPANDATGSANVTITFDVNNIRSISFNWLNSDPGQGAQAIATGVVSYTPGYAPEVGSSAAALLLCGVVLAGGALKRLRKPGFFFARA